MANPKRHHWWPEFHQSLWVDAGGCITSINAEGKVLTTQPKSIAVIGHFNSIRLPDGTKDTTLETYFADNVDSPAGPVLGRLATEKWRDVAVEQLINKANAQRQRKSFRRDGFDWDGAAYSVWLTQEERLDLARYIASLIVRVPSYKGLLNSHEVEASFRDLFGIDQLQARYQADAHHVDIVKQHVEQYSAQLIDRAFVLLEAPPGEEFILGDTPVLPAALGFGQTEAICPLSPDRVLAIIKGWMAPFNDRIGVFIITRQKLRFYNRLILQNAEREIFCRKPISQDIVAKHLGTRQVRLVVEMSRSAPEHASRGPMLDPAAA